MADTLLRASLDALPDAIVVLDRAGRIVESNRAWQRLTQPAAAAGDAHAIPAPADEPYAAQAARLLGLGEGDSRALAAAVARALEDGALGESLLVSGAAGPCRITLQPHDTSGIPLVTVQQSDLSPTDHQFRSVVEESRFGVVVHRHGTPLYVNPAFARLFGYASAEEALAETRPDFWVAPEERERLREYAESRMRGEGAPPRYRYRGIRRDGSRLWVENTVGTVQWHDGPAVLATAYDVTRERQAEEALRQSEAHFRNIVQGSVQGIMILDGRRPLFANQAMASIFGYDDPGEILALGSADALVAPEYREQVRRYAEARMRGEDAPLQYEFMGLRRDGARVWLDNLSTVVEWYGRSAIQIAVYDITERRRYQEELASSQRLLQAVFDTIPHAVFAKDRQGRYLMVNAAWSRLLGQSAEETLGLHTLELPGRPEADAREAVALDEHAMAEPDHAHENEFFRTNAEGQRRRLRSQRKALLDEKGRAVGLVAMTEDVTERYENARLAELAHARLQDAIESLPAAFLLFDTEERLVLWNTGAASLYPELAERLAVGTHVADLERRTAERGVFATPEEVETWLGQRLHAFRNPRAAQELHLTDGRWIQLLDRPTSDGGRVSLRFDITELKTREQALRQAQKMEAIGQLTGGVAHDFNNLLTVILGNLELLRPEVEAGGSAARVLEGAIAAGERGAGLTQRLLAFARKQALHPQCTDLNRLVQEMLVLLQRATGERITTRVALHADTWHVMVDPGQMENALLNLVINARDAMPDGGQLTIATHNARVAHGTAAPGAYVLLTVSDSGGGMGRDVAERAFDPFFTTKAVGAGSGLGLSMVYGFMEQSGGAVRIVSRPGGGTTVCMYLPRAPSDVAAGTSGNTVDWSAARASGEVVLVVEDQPDLQRLAVDFLARLGYTPLPAGHATAALDVLASQPEVSLLFSDIVLPGGMNGFELAREARARRPGLPVLLTSGYRESCPEDAGEADTTVLQKPYRLEELAWKLRELLDAAAGG